MEKTFTDFSEENGLINRLKTDIPVETKHKKSIDDEIKANRIKEPK
jgi:hypothetical protein